MELRWDLFAMNKFKFSIDLKCRIPLDFFLKKNISLLNYVK